jgi:transposase
MGRFRRFWQGSVVGRCQLLSVSAIPGPANGIAFGQKPVIQTPELPYLYRARNQVERFFNRIKQCRRVATRYDRLAANYVAFVQLASIRLWLRLNESAS